VSLCYFYAVYTNLCVLCGTMGQFTPLTVF